MKKWNSGLLWLGIMWGALLIAFCLMGCRTKSMVSTIEIHDTLRVAKTDTLTVYKGIEVHDTVREKEVTTVTVNKEGDTLYVDRWRDRWQNVYVHDTTDTYKAKYDSLLSAKSNVEYKEVVKVRTPWGWKLAAILSLCALVGILAVWLYTRIRKSVFK